jgi:hypothetical protein
MNCFSVPHSQPDLSSVSLVPLCRVQGPQECEWTWSWLNREELTPGLLNSVLSPLQETSPGLTIGGTAGGKLRPRGGKRFSFMTEPGQMLGLLAHASWEERTSGADVHVNFWERVLLQGWRSWSLKTGFTAPLLCDPGQVTSPLWIPLCST